MFLHETEINGSLTAADIVKKQYRTADVFRKYGIDYCCGARWPLSTVCEINGMEERQLLHELRQASRDIRLSPALPFHTWNIDFLTDYIINVHHGYLRETLPGLSIMLQQFIAEHSKKYTYLPALETNFTALHQNLFPHLAHEEEVIFPYIRQVAHAYRDKDSLASLLVKTLRKPVARLLEQEHDLFQKPLQVMRELSNNYTPPERACASHRVVFAKLEELDNDLVQHIYLETDILYQRIIAMEKELLGV